MESLKRFKDAHEQHFRKALAEIKFGKKLSHWMWYIFPQLKGLGLSETSKYYALENIAEATSFLEHPILGPNIITISGELLQLKTNNATEVFGRPDDLKLHSCMTLFSAIPGASAVFAGVLDKYFGGRPDPLTLKLLGKQS
jgi:uncharacterized protein (DUF1810 family)